MADVETKCAHAVCECMVPPRGPHDNIAYDMSTRVAGLAARRRQ